MARRHSSRAYGAFCALVSVLAISLAALEARALDFDSEVRGLSATDVEALKASISALAESDDPRALSVLHALQEGALRVDDTLHEVVWKRDGSWRRASDGAPVSPAVEPRSILVSNAIRRALSPAIARLSLFAREVTTRREAAESLGKDPSPELAPILRSAYKNEVDPGVKRALGVALAQVDLRSPDANARLAAVHLLAGTGALSFSPQLRQMLERDAQGQYLERDARVRDAIGKVLSSLWWTETSTRIIADLLYGLSLGSLLLLAALGLAITFGLMGVINMAHGEILMLGAYTTYAVQTLFQRWLPGYFDYYLLAALPVAFMVCAAAGMALERGVLRFLYGRPLETLLATWGVSLVLIQTVRLVFGAQNVAVAAPSFLTGGWEAMQGVVLPFNRMVIVAFGALVVAFVWWVLTRTRLGLDVRAVTQNRGMAACMGVRTARVDMWTFGVGSGVAGLGGVALSQIGNVGPELGQGYIVDSFMVVVLGGVGKLAGTIVGAFGLGIVNKLLEPFAGAVLGKIVVLGFIILFIQRRPQGIFALKGRVVEG